MARLEVTTALLACLVFTQVTLIRTERLGLGLNNLGALNSVEARMINTIPTHAFPSFVGSSRKISVIYFYKRGVRHLGTALRHFDEAKREKKLKKTAQFAKVNCTKDPAIPHCSVEKSHHFVYIVSQGLVKDAVPIREITEADVIIYRIFQILLDKSLKKIKTAKKLVALQKSVTGHQDIIVSYQMEGKPFERRLFLEFAMDHQKQFMFVVTTKEKIPRILSGGKLPSIPTTWYLHCVEEKEGSETCRSTAYRGLLRSDGLLNFIQAVKLPNVMTFSDQDLTTCRTLGLHVIYVFTNTEMTSEATEVATRLGQAFRGAAGIMVTNLDRISKSRLQAVGVNMTREVELPAVAIQANGHGNLHFVGGFVAGSLLERLQTYVTYYEALQVHKEHQTKKRKTDKDGQGDIVAIVVNKDMVNTINMKHISTLTDKTFSRVVEEERLVVIVFHLKWDVRSKAFMHSYSEASMELTADARCNVTLAQVLCDDWTDVCRLNSIAAYPTVRVFTEGTFLKDYKGMLDTTEFVNFVKLLQMEAPIEIKSVDDAAAFIAGTSPDLLKDSAHTAVVGGFKSRDQEEFKIFKQAARDLHGYFVLGAVTDEKLAAEVCSQFDAEVPCAVVVKRNDDHQQHKVFQEDAVDTEALINFIQVASLPVFAKLTVRSFPALSRMNKPFVILFGGSDSDLGAMGKIAASEQINAVFSWMDLNDPDKLAVELLDVYAASTDIPALVMVDHATGSICHYPHSGNFDLEEIKAWVEECKDDNVVKTGKLLEEKWKPVFPAKGFLHRLDAIGDSAKQLQQPRSPSDEDEEDEGKALAYRTQMVVQNEEKQKKEEKEKAFDEKQKMGRDKHIREEKKQMHNEGKQREDAEKERKSKEKQKSKSEAEEMPRDEL
ncbi:PREDICTED: thioredoxin domain-containing protein 16-like isoform X2 [Branchiostoma belcheri]|uniref:Thioredoxin domain-containing protein 16-like isoform X1 n=1 Tax=Branchiostoma belcheri TaxID=7741 RepID=A0A6P4Y592_BRABE|nr:PREDICTED: thioredoxin domain-containing protein 16-like isoform X1 [Branchiostoma belcheri]XP_019624186.1 PREDICTED: thioredoxin domain-containing protein 16-like isoform X2 [Branchiostoma belcheri]